MDNFKSLGFLLLACKQLNYSKVETRDILCETLILMQTKTSEEADEGFKWYADLNNENEKNNNKSVPSDRNVNLVKQKLLGKSPIITRVPDSYESQLSKENKKLIKLLRSL